ncbi:MAG: Methylated DNA-protein cysteine methyltransferase Ada [Candidatus Methanohalarchaeum thermophilum]|uniref:methylated-DNA--[protein]-cysteine S-methyltransferase n=1 Tax=Methanohalarchaeum thermophilum TaxID=1903181 RepID=A0A1Q6DTD3_METT1|nr:MAG: Methylated DNA-protein cysteine methyltransferase Ada [Candidatus Methanohalarchaeum thermophilum]
METIRFKKYMFTITANSKVKSIRVKNTKSKLGLNEKDKNSIEKRLKNKLRQYFSGKYVELNEEVDLSDLTSFESRVLLEIRKISYGELIGYGELAENIGKPNAIRAVGIALNKNPAPIVIPCHRVVSKNGLGGYKYSNNLKKALIRIESEISRF